LVQLQFFTLIICIGESVSTLAARMAVVPGLSGWITCNALAVKRHLITALTMAGEFTTVDIMKTYRFSVTTVHRIFTEYVLMSLMVDKWQALYIHVGRDKLIIRMPLLSFIHLLTPSFWGFALGPIRLCPWNPMGTSSLRSPRRAHAHHTSKFCLRY